MPIEFLCPSCQQQLRVPDAAAGKNARCPGCSAIAKVPETSQPPAANPLSPPAQPGFNFGPPEPKPSAPSGGSFGAPPSNSFGAPPPGNPFGDSAAKNQWGDQYSPAPGTLAGGGVGGGGPVNPYASPAGTYGEPAAYGGGIGNQSVDFGTVFNYSFKVWQDNLGLLVGTTLVAFILQFVAAGVGQVVLAGVAQANEPALIVVASLFVELAKFVFQIFVGIGQVQISLKLARQQRADFGDLFGGGSRLLPVLGWSFLVAIIVYAPLLIVAVIAGVGIAAAGGGGRGGGEVVGLIILAFGLLWVVALVTAILYFWPAYFLVVDGRSSVLGSFGQAARISEGNKLNVVVLWFVSVLIMFLGVLAICVGVLFAAPLVGMLFAVAYLMMSRQIPAYYQR